DQLGDLYYTLLLKDLGCSSNAARICDLYLADDLAFKNDFKRVDGSLTQVLSFVLTHTGANAGFSDRVRAIVNILKNGTRISTQMIETRCQRGAAIARQMRFPETVADGILDLDEHWDGGGKPLGRKGVEISVLARIALLAQVIDVFHLGGGRAAAIAEIRSRSGRWFDPAIVDVFLALADRAAFWEGLEGDGVEQRVLAMEPGREAPMVDEDYLDDIAAAFAQVIDAKSPFTFGHSERVALFTELIAQEMGYDAARCRRLKRAALLHDIGKLGVSNAILDHPGKPDEAQWLAIKRHPEYSQNILARIEAFKDLSIVAGAHHERLDGKGYPRGIAGDEIDLDTRIVSTADVFDALTADRPYRPAMPTQKALAILSEGAGASHDPACIAALERVLARTGLASTGLASTGLASTGLPAAGREPQELFGSGKS
ncbi:MAG TPA: HD domain-containing phosphohydrolase, partial [Saliniramus sp.]|nr:HD domain-containing phosphohydrolase [Saliniramus sp.]